MRGNESDATPTVSPRTQQVRSVQSVLASISSAAAASAADRPDVPPRAPTYSFNDMSASHLLPQLQSISLRPHSGVLDYYGYETDYNRAPMTTQAGHASWSGNASTPSSALVPATRHHSLPLGSSDHVSSNDYFQSEQVLRRRTLDPLAVEQQALESHRPSAAGAAAHSSLAAASFARPNLPPAPPSSSIRPPEAMETDQDDNFLEKIYSVLGPMQSERDPMEPYLHEDARKDDRNK